MGDRAGATGCGILCLALLAPVASGSPGSSVPSTAPRRVGSPHGRADGCSSCHQRRDGAWQPVALAKADAICTGCHDGRRAVAEVHPSGVVRWGDGTKQPADWPTPGGRLSCLTCHDVKRTCDPVARPPQTNRMFLRGPEKGKVVEVFCGTCHEPEAHRRFYPHLMLAADGEIIEAACLICHTKVLSRATRFRSGSPSLRGEQVTLCRGCHPTHPRVAPRDHVGMRVPVQTIARLMPEVRVSADRRIVCSTCHNPHEVGVFTRRTVLTERAMQQVSPDRVRTPTRDHRPCTDCHEDRTR